MQVRYEKIACRYLLQGCIHARSSINPFHLLLVQATSVKLMQITEVKCASRLKI